VLDASALITSLRNEPGADKVAPVFTQSCISAVNLAETISKLVVYGRPLDAAAYQIERLRIPLAPFDGGQARLVASLSQATRMAGLSLGDGACMALGLQQGLPVLTADGKWTEVDVGVPAEMIR
jgi:ribonuclease VapC